jgi:hypothetical protein
MELVQGRPMRHLSIGACRAVTVRTVVAASAIALLPFAAHAQSNRSLDTSRDQRSGYSSTREYKPKYYQKEIDDPSYRARDKSYQDALRSIPDARPAPDPWKDAR